MQLIVRGEVAALPLKGVIDFAVEKTRLEKEMARVNSDIARIDAKLANADFVARAPEEVVEGEREKREEAETRRAKINRSAGAAQGHGVSHSSLSQRGERSKQNGASRSREHSCGNSGLPRACSGLPAWGCD